MSRLFPITGMIALLLAAAPLDAHDARPLSITLIEQASAGLYRAVIRIPPTIEPANRPVVRWPAGCVSAGGTDAAVETALVRCAGGLESGRLVIEYPYYNPSITTLIRLQRAGEPMLTAVLPPDRLDWTPPARPTRAAVARDYLLLGFEHIWRGIDHLLFVAGLLLLARGRRGIVLAITGFTAAHSLTLALAALGLVRPAVAPIETLIALSIVFLAAEIARGDPASFSRRYPVVLSFAFGLLHGFGFAGALGEIGLPGNELVTGLLMFNVGVELGQLAFVGIALATAALLAAARVPTPGAPAAASGRLTTLAAYGLGIPASFWTIDRAAGVFGF